MSDINLDFQINNNAIQFTVEPTDITFTPSDIQLNVYAGGVGVPGGSIGQIQYNAGNVLDGSSNLVYNAGTGATIVANLVSTIQSNLGPIGNIIITGGNANAVLTTNGSGILSWGDSVENSNHANIADIANSVAGANVTGIVANATYAANAGNSLTANYAAYAGNITIANQPNITGLGTLTGLQVTGNINFTTSPNISLGSISNLKITGGLNGYFLQTDGSGNLTWAAGGGGGGNGSPGGSNTQIQFNDSGIFGGNVGFTFNKSTGVINMPNDLTVVGNVVGGNIYANLANIANTAGTVTTAAQPNITSVGTLTSLSVSGNITTGNISATSNITASNLNGTLYGPIGDLTYGIENVSLITAQTGTYNFDLISSAIRYNTSNASANLILNYRGNSSITANTLVANGHSITSTYVLKNGATPYSITSITIDGISSTIKWVNGAAPLTGANSMNSYTFTIIKTSTSPTYDVLGSMTRYS